VAGSIVRYEVASSRFVYGNFDTTLWSGSGKSISLQAGKVGMRVVETQEELEIYLHCRAMELAESHRNDQWS
jgi:hypothetical protein